MKIRTGFVSNSSSSSFVLGKNYMTPEQIRELSCAVTEIERLYEGSCIFEDERYFFGSISDHDENFRSFIRKHDLVNFVSYGY